MLLVCLSLLLGLAASTCAYRFGGDVERHAAKLVFLMMVIGVVGDGLMGSTFHAANTASAVQDMIGLIGFSILGINSRRVWPLWAAAFQLLSVGAHLVRAFEMDVRPVVYAWMKSGPTWAVLVVLLIGTVGHRRRMSLRANARCSQG